MKIFLMTIFGIMSATAFSQTPQNNYNTKINKAQTVNIYGNGKTIIGKIIINQSIKSKILLASNLQVKDTSGDYITVFTFVNSEQEGVPFFAVKIHLKFNSPVILVEPKLIGETVSSFSTEYALVNNNTGFEYKAAQINAEGLQIGIRSKSKIITEITGIDGKK